MHDARAVCLVEGIRHFASDAQHLVDGKRTFQSLEAWVAPIVQFDETKLPLSLGAVWLGSTDGTAGSTDHACGQ